MTPGEGHLSRESLAGRARRTAATIRPAAGWLAILLVVLAASTWLLFDPASAAAIPLWAFAVVLAIATVTAWLFVRAALGYRPASPEELAQLQAGSLWHVSAADLVDELDAGHCRRFARMIRRDRFFARRQAAVYVFSARPSMGDVRGQVTARRRGTLYRLEGSCVTGAFVRHTGEVALLGYTGPIVAEIEL